MNFKTNIEKKDTLEIVNSKYINWDFFKNSTIMITGATGLIGSQIVLSILFANEKLNTNINILAIVRNKEKAEKKFKDVKTDKIEFIVQDITKAIDCERADFIIHTANSTASKDFVENPVETIDSIYTGTKNVLEYAKDNNVKSIIYLSSMEVYGNIGLDRKEPLKEEDYGYMNIMKVRSSYPLGKKIAENMCFSYYSEYQVPIKIARLCQTIGAGIDYNDNRVFMQFARNVIEKKDIILNTKGETIRSYCYITDCVAAILCLLEKGKSGEVYNVANPETTCSIKEMAEILCNKYPTSNLKIEIKENNCYLETIKYVLDISKIETCTIWKPEISLADMFERLIKNHKEGEIYE